MKELLAQWKADDRKQLLSMIPFWHGFYARSKNPVALEISRNLGIAAKNLMVK